MTIEDDTATALLERLRAKQSQGGYIPQVTAQPVSPEDQAATNLLNKFKQQNTLGYSDNLPPLERSPGVPGTPQLGPTEQDPSGVWPTVKGLAKKTLIDPITGGEAAESVEHLPELAFSGGDAVSPKGFAGTLKTAAGMMFTATDEEKKDIIKENFPGAKIEPDKYGQQIITLPNEKQFVLNKDGLSAQDWLGFLGDAALYYGPAKIAAAFKTFKARALATAAGDFTTDIVSQAGAQLLGSKQEVDPYRSAITATFGVLGEGASTLIGKKIAKGKAKKLDVEAEEFEAAKKATVWAERVSKETGIPLFRAQKTGNLNSQEIQAFVAQLSGGSKIAQDAMKAQDAAIFRSLKKRLDDLAPPSSTETGPKAIQTASQGALDKAKAERKTLSKPFYDEAFGTKIKAGEPVFNLEKNHPDYKKQVKYLKSLGYTIADPQALEATGKKGDQFYSPSVTSEDMKKQGYIGVYAERNLSHKEKAKLLSGVFEGKQDEGLVLGFDPAKPAVKTIPREVKDWFKGGDLKDDYGQPRIVYHGSAFKKNIKDFKMSPHDEAAIDGISFSTDKNVAQKYADDVYGRGKGKESGVTEAYVRGKHMDAMQFQEDAAAELGLVGDDAFDITSEQLTAYALKHDIGSLDTSMIGEPTEIFVTHPSFIKTVGAKAAKPKTFIETPKTIALIDSELGPISGTGDEYETLLKRVKKSIEPTESAILSGKPGAHIKALDISFKRLGDRIKSAIKDGRTYEAGVLVDIKTSLLDEIEQGAPAYKKAVEMFKKHSKPVNELQESLVGNILDLDKGKLEDISKIIFKERVSQKPMHDLKAVVMKESPDAWNQIVRFEIEKRLKDLDALPGLEGNFPAKLHNALFGGNNLGKRKSLYAAMDNEQKRNFRALEEALKMAKKGRPGGSQTGVRKVIEKSMRASAGLVNALEMFLQPVKTITDKLGESSFNRKVKAMAQVYFDPKWKADMKLLRKTNPRSEKAKREFSNILRASFKSLRPEGADPNQIEPINKPGAMPVNQEDFYNESP